MKLPKINITVLVLAGCCIIMLIFIISLLKKNKTPSGTNDIIKAYDQVIKAKDETIAVYREQNIKLDEVIEAYEKTDSILLARLTANQPKYTANDKKLKDVIASGNSITDIELERAYTTY